MDTITQTLELLSFFFFFLSALKENFTHFAAYFFSCLICSYFSYICICLRTLSMLVNAR